MTREPYTFSDIKKYTRVYYFGNPGWVIDKGEHVGKTKESAILIEIDSGLNNSDIHEITITQGRVNRYLREQRQFWVDFGELFAEHYLGKEEKKQAAFVPLK